MFEIGKTLKELAEIEGACGDEHHCPLQAVPDRCEGVYFELLPLFRTIRELVECKKAHEEARAAHNDGTMSLAQLDKFAKHVMAAERKLINKALALYTEKRQRCSGTTN